MKCYMLLLSIAMPAISLAMGPAIEIRDRNLNTAKEPHITIINQLPKDIGFFTRIDISDKTMINNYTKDSYRPDDSTQTIYFNQGIRFSPRFNKTDEPEHQRLGMNDAGDAALLVVYLYGAKNNELHHLVVGKGSFIPFGETITITAASNMNIYFTNNDDTLDYWKQPTVNPEDKEIVSLVGIPDPGSIRFRHIDSGKLNGLRLILATDYLCGRYLLANLFLEENPYMKKILGNPTKNEIVACFLRNQKNIEKSKHYLSTLFNNLLRDNPGLEEQLAEIYSQDDILDEY
jgi:hypothetical protein